MKIFASLTLASFVLVGTACGPSSPPATPPAAPSVPPPPASASADAEKRADLSIPELDRSAFRPEMRTPADVSADEASRFGYEKEPEPATAPGAPVQAESPEDKIRRVLGLMPVRGLAGQDCGNRVLLGSMTLGVGDTVPRLFADQALGLRVQQITGSKVVLVITNNGKSVELAYDLSPQVRSVLPGEIFADAALKDNGSLANTNPLATPLVDEITSRLKASPEKVRDIPRATLGEPYGP